MGPIRKSSVALAAGLIAAIGAGCGSSGGSSSTASSSATSSAAAPSAHVAHGQVKVAIRSYAFHPANLAVATGTKVTFTNYDSTAHTATGRSGGFDTGSLADHASRTITLSKPGTYSYYCQFHAFMTGTITVR